MEGGEAAVQANAVVPAEYRISLADVHVIEGREGLIGRGALGEVRRGRYAGTEVALKGLHMLRTDAEALHAMGGALGPAERRALQADFFRECDILRQAVHPNVLPFIGVVVDAQGLQPLYLATQYIESGTLHDVLYNPRHAALRSDAGHLPFETQLIALEGLFGALAYLANLPLIHRDIKPPNILAVVEEGRLVKVLLADFGEAKQLSQTMTHIHGTMAGTPVYMAPEMRGEDDAKGPKADVFSAGIVAVEISTQRQPNPGPEMQRQGGRRVFVPEEQRRAADIAAVRHPFVAEVVGLTVVDDEATRADAATIHRLCLERLQAARPAREATVHVKVHGGRRISVLVQGTTKIAELTCSVLAELGGQRLLFAGRPMEPGQTVDDYNLLDGTVVHMLGMGAAMESVDRVALREERTRRAEVEHLNAQLVADGEAKDAQLAAQDAELQRYRQKLRDQAATIAQLQRAAGGAGSGAAGPPHEAVPPAMHEAAPAPVLALAPEPAPVPVQAVLQITNAGTLEVNGYYKEDGDRNGKKSYRHLENPHITIGELPPFSNPNPTRNTLGISDSCGNAHTLTTTNIMMRLRELYVPLCCCSMSW